MKKRRGFERSSRNKIDKKLLYIILIIVLIGAVVVAWRYYGSESEDVGLSPSDGLVTHYQFEGNPNDAFGNNATESNLIYVPGKIGLSAGFSGSNYVKIPDNNLLELNTQTGTTFSFWTKIPSSTPGAGSALIVFDKRESNFAKDYQFFIRPASSTLANDGAFQVLGASGNAGLLVLPNGTVKYDMWNHWAIVYSGAPTNGYGMVSVYNDGVLVKSITLTSLPASGSNALNIGRRTDNQLYYQGAIDDLRIYNRVLNVTDIQSLMVTNLTGGGGGSGGGGNVSSSSSYKIVYSDFVLDPLPNGSYVGVRDIFLYDLTTGTNTRITNDNSNEGEPSIYKDKIVYYDWVLDPLSNGSFAGKRDLFVYNLSTGTTLRITNDGSSEGEPSIYKDKIVYYDWVLDPLPNGSYIGTRDIFVYDLTAGTNTRITNDNSNEGEPSITECLRSYFVEGVNVGMCNQEYPNTPDCVDYIINGEKVHANSYGNTNNNTCTYLTNGACLLQKGFSSNGFSYMNITYGTGYFTIDGIPGQVYTKKISILCV